MKKIAQIDFYKCIQDSQDFGSNNEHCISRIFFKITIGEKVEEFFANVNQPYGSNFSYEYDPVEISNPFNQEIPFNYHEFRDEAEKYYRMCVCANANGIQIVASSNIRMRNNTFNMNYSKSIIISENSPAW